MNSEMYQPVVVGINYKTATIPERGLFQINKKEIRSALKYFKSVDVVGGLVIVSTCNRLEFYFSLKCDADPLSILDDFYNHKRINVFKEKQKLFYAYRGIGVAKHLFKVITGLDSMLTGEYQIQGQVKDAYSIACSEKTADKFLHKLFHNAFHTGKEVRTQTKIGSGNQSLSGVAFNIIKEKVDLSDSITIIGVNQNTKIITEKLVKAGYSHLTFVNRTLHKAEKLADTYDGCAIGLDKLEKALVDASCVFSCTGAPGFIIDANLINKIRACRRLPKLVIDMAVPHDIETKGIGNEMDVIDLDGLQMYLDRQQEDISLDIPKANKIISDEANIFDAWLKSVEADKDVYIVEEKVEAIRLQLLNETKPKISNYELKLLDNFSRSLICRMKTAINESVRMNSVANRSFKGGY